MTVLRVAPAQLNPSVGDLDGSLATLIAAYGDARAADCDVVALPELSVTGYPPEDLAIVDVPLDVFDAVPARGARDRHGIRQRLANASRVPSLSRRTVWRVEGFDVFVAA